MGPSMGSTWRRAGRWESSRSRDFSHPFHYSANPTGAPRRGLAHPAGAQGTWGGRELPNISGIPVSGLGEQGVAFRARLCNQGALSSNPGPAVPRPCHPGQVTDLSEPVSSSAPPAGTARAKGAHVGNGAWQKVMPLLMLSLGSSPLTRGDGTAVAEQSPPWHAVHTWGGSWSSVGACGLGQNPQWLQAPEGKESQPVGQWGGGEPSIALVSPSQVGAEASSGGSNPS